MTLEYKIKKAQREAKLNRQRRNFLLGIISVIALVWFMKSGVFMTTTEASYTTFDYITVQKGDSLWSICQDYVPYGEDIRPFIKVVASYNNIDNLMVTDGQILKIPLERR